jgi:hypothetical protein
MSARLDKLTGAGKPLALEPPDKREFDGLKRSGLARLADAQMQGLSLEGRFDLANNASHALCLAALRWHGYRANHRYIVFQVLPHTLGLGPEVWRVLAKCHDVRNLGEYEGDLNIDDRLVADLLAACQAVAEQVAELAQPSEASALAPLSLVEGPGIDQFYPAVDEVLDIAGGQAGAA